MPSRGTKSDKNTSYFESTSNKAWMAFSRARGCLFNISAALVEHFLLTGQDEALSMLAAALHA